MMSSLNDMTREAVVRPRLTQPATLPRSYHNQPKPIG
jgi:hypothetical protein